jgi:hypothetical protein
MAIEQHDNPEANLYIPIPLELPAVAGWKEFVAPTVYLEVAAEAAEGLDTKVTSLPKAAIIAPPEQKAA